MLSLNLQYTVCECFFHWRNCIATSWRNNYQYELPFSLRFRPSTLKRQNASKTLQPDTAHVPYWIILLYRLGLMSYDRFLIDITHAFLKSPIHTSTFSFENASFSMRFRKPSLWEPFSKPFVFSENDHSHLFIVLVWTEGENASKNMRIQIKTY